MPFCGLVGWFLFPPQHHLLVNSNIKEVPASSPPHPPVHTLPYTGAPTAEHRAVPSQKRDLKPFTLFICQQQLLGKKCSLLPFFIIINKELEQDLSMCQHHDSGLRIVLEIGLSS